MQEVDLIAFTMLGAEHWGLCPAPRQREWMDAVPRKFIYRCLPVTMANQAGWFVLCPTNVKVMWNGGDAPEDTAVELEDDKFGRVDSTTHSGNICSHFGSGVLTFALPWFFRTTVEGIGLQVSGPTNAWIPNAHALTGVVETWGHVSTFTMNWKITVPDTIISIPKGFPICFLSLYDFSLNERARTWVTTMDNMAEQVDKELSAWSKKRDTLLLNKEAAMEGRGDGAYARNENTDGEKNANLHWTKFDLAEFNLATTPAGAEDDSKIDQN